MVKVYLTGEICMTMGGRLVRADRLPRRQGRLVFAYLVTERDRTVSRDELAESLWPDHLPAAADLAVSAIVSKLRGLFSELGAGRQTIEASPGGYKLNLPAESWVDIEEALASVHLAEAAIQASSPATAYGPAVVACAILRRPFMTGEEGAWVDARRETLHRAHVRALDCLAQIHTATGEHSLAVRAALEAIELEPFREIGYQRLMLAHAASGNRAEALRVYSRLEAVLKTELKTTPSREMRKLAESVVGK
ncbi:MAG TPA: BTAD domain-containing putative transcriptional regulator [Candidatus Dormibacteraeota bacterium]|nr:BTAD domain-containing putative transcriptional regulator [Candidatus Dormibacteraeota bacterium]